MAELLFLRDEVPVLRVPLTGAPVRLGRSPRNDVCIPAADVAPHACTVEHHAGGWCAVDATGAGLVQADGTSPRVTLTPTARVVIGPLVMTLRDEGGDGSQARATSGQPRTGILRRQPDGAFLCATPELVIDGKRFPIPDDGVRLGADTTNDIVLTDPFASSFHAVVYPRGERVFLRDLDSTNGSFIGTVRVVEAEIPFRVDLRFGETRARLESREAPTPVDKPAGQGPWELGALRTQDAGFAEVLALLRRVAEHDATVVIFGETGTGKDLAARALHEESPRRRGPFVPLNCAAVPETLIESMLFGHEKGAFTGADRQHRGVFEEADGGTLFLDEIGELPIAMQAKLLRVLENRSVRRVGGHKDTPVDVRVVAATHRDLVDQVREKRFREDLLHRLYVVPVTLPALRNRPGEIAFLARHFAASLAPSGQEASLSPAALARLAAHPFPGNVRELKNVLQRALILRRGSAIEGDDIQFLKRKLDDAHEEGRVFHKGMTLDEIERRAIAEALDAFPTAAEAARALGIPKTTFWRRASALGLLKKDQDH